MELRSQVGEEMARVRKLKKLTQAELAQAVGVSQRTIAAIEGGTRRPSPELAQKLGGVLGFSWVLFFEGDGAMDAETDDTES